MQNIVAARGIAQHIGTGDDFVFIIVTEPRYPRVIAVEVKFKAELFIDADFRVEIRVTQKITTSIPGDVDRAAVSARRKQVAFARLIQIRRFKLAGNTCFDLKHIPQILRQVQTRAPVAAKFIVIVKTQSGDDIGARHRLNIIFQVEAGEGRAVGGAALGGLA